MCWMILYFKHGRFTVLPVSLFTQIHRLTSWHTGFLWRERQRSIGVYFGTFDPIHENHVALAKFTFGRPKGWGSKLRVWGGFDIKAPWGSWRLIYVVYSVQVWIFNLHYLGSLISDVLSKSFKFEQKSVSRACWSSAVWPFRAMCDHLDVFVTFHQTLAWWMDGWISRNAESKGLRTVGGLDMIGQ